jgi:hypothetical protein
MSQYVSGNFSGFFEIFKIFFVDLMNYLGISRLFFSQKCFLKIKINIFLYLSLLPPFGPFVLRSPKPKSAATP